MVLLKKYFHRLSVTACAIEFKKIVGADSYVRPKVPFCMNKTALRHKIMVCINLMDECINRASMLRQGGHIKLPIVLLEQSAALFCPYGWFS